MKNLLEFVMNYWSLIIALIAIIIVVVLAVKGFIKLPTSVQQEKIKKCLLAWVIRAEKDLGGGTGKVKLSTVYGIFVTTFPILKNFISFDTFSLWVDDALDEMREMLEENENLKQVVEGNIIEGVLISSEDAITPLQENTKE